MRTYGEDIDVRTTTASASGCAQAWLAASGRPGADVPSQFLWRGRPYLVRDVLAHWVELGTWWSVRAPLRRPSRPAVLSLPSDTVVDAECRGGAPSRSVAADVGAVEREVWRVEAVAGRSGTPGVYDLVRDVPARRAGDVGGAGDAAASRWRLARSLD